MLAAALRADPEAGNLRFPGGPSLVVVEPTAPAREERIAASRRGWLLPRCARILKPGTNGSP